MSYILVFSIENALNYLEHKNTFSEGVWGKDAWIHIFLTSALD
jgi:hypothetical protein